MSLDLRKRILKCLVWGVALYAAETWTLSKRLKHLKCGYGEGWQRSAGQQKLAILKFCVESYGGSLFLDQHDKRRCRAIAGGPRDAAVNFDSI